MVGPGGPSSYVGPFRAALAALLLLPIGYWFIARKTMPAIIGAAITLMMVSVAIGLWMPLVQSGGMRTIHSGPLVVWTALWLVASLPFMRVMVKRLRKPRR